MLSLLPAYRLLKAWSLVVSVGLCLVAGCAVAQQSDDAALVLKDTSGQIVRSYTRDQFREEFTPRERTTDTPWSLGVPVGFRGPFLKDILAKNNLLGGSFEISGADSFVAKISSEEIERYAPILATEKKCTDEDKYSGACSPGQTYRLLSIDDGGPLYLIWPLHDLPPRYLPSRNAIWVWFVISIKALS
ncbi:hypothetical protein [Phyllobacterium sp. UNC302MFCol5.2]|uniref:hypothetical protein n=1 Tax=Phyllobacterium sp. UNC302MFCol5.2 TaxID=1449065 RepID=UPI00048413EC|nr:hypothetical protein [Phyllobacterium sp. UNC302MFCol5.2]